MNNSPSSSREFKYPALLKIALLVIIPIMVIAVLLSSDEDPIIGLVLAGIFVLLLLFVLFKMTGTVRLEPTGVSMARPLRAEVRLQWQEVASVSSNWTDTEVRLQDAMRERKISFSLMLNGFQQLVDAVYQRRPDLFAVSPGQEFGAGALRWLQVVFFIFLFLLFLFVGLNPESAETSWTGLLFLGILVVVLVAFVFFRPTKILFEHDRMLVKSMLGKQEVLRNSILDVVLTVTGGRSRTLLVRVNYHDPAAGKDKHINLTGFACGSPRLYGAIRSWANITEQNKFSAYQEN